MQNTTFSTNAVLDCRNLRILRAMAATARNVKSERADHIPLDASVEQLRSATPDQLAAHLALIQQLVRIRMKTEPTQDATSPQPMPMPSDTAVATTSPQPEATPAGTVAATAMNSEASLLGKRTVADAEAGSNGSRFTARASA